MFGLTKRNEVHTVFYNTLYIFHDNPMALQEILEVVRNLLLNKKVCIFHFTGPNMHFFRYGYVKYMKLSLGDV